MAPAGSVAVGGDCDDTDPSVVAPSIWYLDADGDGFGGSVITEACVRPISHTEASTDCDDSVSSVFPGADEVCNDVDDDCDGTVDGPDALDAILWGTDGDGDGACVWETLACSAPDPGLSCPEDADCDDDDSERAPTLEESCKDGVDNDCDARIDCEDGQCADVCVEHDCTDGLDEDFDGVADCNDDDCIMVDSCVFFEVALTGGTYAHREGPGGGGVQDYTLFASPMAGEVRGWNAADSSWQACSWSVNWIADLRWVSGITFSPRHDNFALESGCEVVSSSGFLPERVAMMGWLPGKIYAEQWYQTPRGSSTYWSWTRWVWIDGSPRSSSTTTNGYQQQFYDIPSGATLRLAREEGWTP